MSRRGRKTYSHFNERLPRGVARLVRLIAISRTDDSIVYGSNSACHGGVSFDEEPLAWDSEGLEDVICGGLWR